MKTDKKQIIVCGNYGASNLGDDAILAGLIGLIHSTWPNNEIFTMSHTPAKTANDFKVKAISFFPAGFRSFFKFWFSSTCWKTLKAVYNSNLIILGGGGLFSDEKKRAVWIWFVQFLGFWLMRKPIVCLAQSVGPLKSSWSKSLTRFVFKRCLLVTVRDKQSKVLLENLGIHKVQVLPDPAFAIGYKSEQSLNKQKQIVLSLRDWIRGDEDKINHELAELIDFIWVNFNIKTVFIPFQNEIDDDKIRYRKMALLLKHPEAMTLKVVQDYSQAIEVIGRSEMVIGMRLHSIIFAILAGTPFVAISYSKKVKDFLETTDLGELCTNYSDLNSERVKQLFIYVQNNREQIVSKLAAQKLKNTYGFFEHEKLLKAML